jgi:hypothetical protein
VNPAELVAIAEAVLEGIAKLIEEYKSAKTGNVDPQAVLAKLAAMTGTLQSDDEAADAAVDAKFPKP